MVTLKVVPREDYEVLMRYLDEDGVILLSEAILETFTPEAQMRFLELDSEELDYSFGGELELYVDVIRSDGGYTYQMLLGTEDEEADQTISHQ